MIVIDSNLNRSKEEMAWEMREEAAKRNQAANKEREAKDKLKEQTKKEIDIDEKGITIRNHKILKERGRGEKILSVSFFFIYSSKFRFLY